MEFKYTNIFTSFFGGGTILYMAIYSIITDVTEPHERAQRWEKNQVIQIDFLIIFVGKDWPWWMPSIGAHTSSAPC